MNLYSESGSSARFYAVGLVIAAILFCASVSAAFGQQRSEDRDNPTLLNSNKIDDDLDGSGSEYFYKFTAGPGKLTVTFDVKASGTNAGATLDLFDANSKPILSDVLAQGVDGGSERVVKSVQMSRKRDILMRIKGVKYGDSGGTGTYKVTLDGPVSFAQGAAPDGGGGAVAPAGDNLVSGELDGSGNQFFHQVSVTGPGAVTFTFSVKAKDPKAGANFAVTDPKGRIIVTGIVVQVVDGGSQTVSKTVTLDTAQRIIIFGQGIKPEDNGGRGTYTVQLSGPATFVK